MPKGDRRGPMGMGPMSGRGAGYCAGYTIPGFANRGQGQGAGRGFGRGQGLGRGYGRGQGFGQGRGFGWGAGLQSPHFPFRMRFGGTAAPYRYPDTEVEKQNLSQQAEALEAELDFIRKRLDEIDATTASE